VILGAGLAWYALKGWRHIGTLASHTLSQNVESLQAEV
jgi:hypothetical protein